MLGNMPLVTFGLHAPDIGDGVFLAPNATLIGEVTISRGVTIMFGAVLRAAGGSNKLTGPASTGCV